MKVIVSEELKSRLLGKTFLGKAVKYKGKIYPDFLFKRGRPIKNLILYLQIEKLYEQVDK